MSRYYPGFLCVVMMVFGSLLSGHRHASATPNETKSSKHSRNIQSNHPSWQNARVAEGRVIVKFKPSIASTQRRTQSRFSPESQFQNKYPHFQLKPLLKNRKKTSALKSQSAISVNPLERIYVLDYTSGEDPRKLAEMLSLEDNIEYAEPHFIRQTHFVPDEPNFEDFWWLANIQATKAWDITKGDTSVVVAIIDTGVDWNHEDLADNIKINWDEIPDDGLDNDGNGYVDDVRGWDFGSTNNFPGSGGIGDNDPSEEGSYTHGTHVAGIASGVTNNSLGIASVGYHTKLLPIKASIDNAEQGSIYYGYEGILYAAESGAQIINCSWGGEGFSNTEKFIIDYVTETYGALVVASSGNSGNDGDLFPLYPASYDNVLSVGNVTIDDLKSFSSNYGIRNCDIMAPGSLILSTFRPNSYNYLTGTSMSSPMVAGAAALVKALHPSYSPQQLIEQLRSTADDIDSLNPQYAGKLGAGRLNIYRALSENDKPGIRIKSVSFLNQDGNSALQNGDTVSIDLILENILAEAELVALSLSSESATVQILASEAQLSQIPAGSDVFVNNLRFKVNDALKNEKVKFVLDISSDGGSYETKAAFEAILKTDIVSAQNQQNQIDITINSNGNIGYDDFPDNQVGNGFTFRGYDLLYEGAFMIGNSAMSLNDVGRTTGGTQSEDFQSLSPLNKIQSPEGDIILQASFEDNGLSSDLGLEIDQQVFVFNSDPDTSFALISYMVHNVSGQHLTNLHAGLLMDWDVIEYNINQSGYIPSLQLLYTFHPTQHIYVGVLGLEYEMNAHVTKNDTVGALNDEKKWQYISNGLQDTLAQGDLMSFYANGPFSINSNDSALVGFALVAGSGKQAFMNNALLAQLKWQEIKKSLNVEPQPKPEISSYKLEQNYPNPFNPVTTISYNLPTTGKKQLPVKLKVYDVLGREVAVLVDQKQASGNYRVVFNASALASGLYFYRLQADDQILTKKMILIK